ncbi:hypothetical protein R3P38DRAFT_3044423 [Favolaschia claudopus]|uniref:Uncharacterized protein n=1 Tax=Favolaschia claudopus TaxID=2862362 RepID=A0AAW0A7B8_9AGAR
MEERWVFSGFFGFILASRISHGYGWNFLLHLISRHILTIHEHLLPSHLILGCISQSFPSFIYVGCCMILSPK